VILDSYKSIGGVHPETASIKNILAFNGVKAPHSGKAFTEAMIFGIAGGLGAMYILWEFEKHGYPSLVVGFRYKGNYSVQYLEQLSPRMGAESQVYESGGQKKALAYLEETLAKGLPAITWMDLGGPPYYMHINLLGVGVVYGIEEGKALVDKRAKAAFEIPMEALTKARAKVPSFKNRVMTVEPKKDFDLEAAIRDGIQDCVDYLGAKSTSFALPSLRKWARMMTDEKNEKGWPTVHKNGRGLYGTLRTAYEAIEQTGSGGGGLRGVYADFLDEAADVLDNAALEDSAHSYRALQAEWSGLAQAVLPNEVAVFSQTKELLDRKEALILEKGSAAIEEIGPINDELHEIKGELNDDFPLDKAGRKELFQEMQSRLTRILEAEKAALAALEASIA
jgi:hypothetical protein